MMEAPAGALGSTSWWYGSRKLRATEDELQMQVEGRQKYVGRYPLADGQEAGRRRPRKASGAFMGATRAGRCELEHRARERCRCRHRWLPAANSHKQALGHVDGVGGRPQALCLAGHEGLVLVPPRVVGLRHMPFLPVCALVALMFQQRPRIAKCDAQQFRLYATPRQSREVKARNIRLMVAASIAQDFPRRS